MSFFGDLFGNEAAQDAANAKISGLNQGYQQASGLFDQGRGALQTNYAAGLAPFQKLMNLGANGAQAYGDATGANGPAGFARAVSSFQTSPGYDFARTQGLQAIDRGAASRGMLSSGNTLMGEQQFGNNLANQEFGNYVSRLAPYLGQQTSANLAGAQGQGSLYANLGNSLNSSLGNQGILAYNTQSGIGNANAAADLARLGGEQNLFDGIGSAVSLGTKLMPFL